MFRDALVLGARAIVGGYVAAHGAQKLFGSFGGHGLEGTGGFFEQLGLAPGKAMAAAAGTSELAGGALTAAGAAHPAGPATIVSTMVVASATAHTGKGAFAATNGPELPLTNLAACLALAATDPGRFSVDRALGTRLTPRVTAVIVAGGTALSAALVARAKAATLTEAEDGPEQLELDTDEAEERRSA